jgi:radical SAM protein with 4Fe4S-binding SPASM domain
MIKKEIYTPFFSIETTLRCNLKCTMCSNPSESEGTPLSKHEIGEIITEAMKFTNQIIFTGGEPLLDENLPYYCSLVPQNKHITLLTNGTLFSSANFSKIANRISELRVSIDDALTTENSIFRLGSSPQKIVQDLIKVRDLNKNMFIVITSIINESIVNNLIEFFRYFETSESKVNIIRFIPQVYYKGRAPENLKKGKYKSSSFTSITNSVANLVEYYISNKLFNQIDLDIQHLFSSKIFNKEFEIKPLSSTNKCCEYQNGFNINNNGDLILCPSSDDVLGNIREYKSVKQLLSFRFSSRFVNKHSTARVKISDKTECINCRYSRYCGGGCPANSLSLTRNVLIPDPIKCSLIVLWEQNILPLYPLEIYNRFISILNFEGVKPKCYSDIYEIMEFYNT